MNNVHVLFDEIFGISEREAGRWMGVEAQSTVNRWSRTDSPPIALSRVFGVRYDWLIGESSTMWGDKKIELTRRLRMFLVNVHTASPSERFRIVATWLIENSDFVTERYLAALLRLIDRFGNIDTYRDMASGLVPASDNAINRLATWTEIPRAWFVDGDSRHVADDGFVQVVERARNLGMQASDLDKLIDVYASVRSGDIA